MALPNPGMDAVPFTPLTAEFLDDMIENIESLSDGTGFENGAITTNTLADNVFPWVNYSPVVTGFSSLPGSSVYRYRKVGKTVDLAWSQGTNGTSNSGGFTIELPFPSSGDAPSVQMTVVQPVNNGTVATAAPGIVAIPPGSTVATLYRDLNGSTWTASGGKRVPTGYISYECS